MNNVKSSARFLHLLALWAFAGAQPLFEKLGTGAEFLIVKELTKFDIALFIIFLSVGVPVLLFLVEGLFSFFNKRSGEALHLFFIFLLSAIIFLPPLSSYARLSGVSALIGALFAAFLLVFFYNHKRTLRSFISALSLFSIIAPVVFFFQPSIRELFVSFKEQVDSQITLADPPPIVFVLFDEFPLSSLLNSNEEIDSKRFPNFAKLAEASTWYRNTTAVSTHTTLAVPAILTGRYPSEERKMPLAATHPENLFTLLPPPYSLHVWEKITRLCPRSKCSLDREISFIQKSASLLADTAAIYLRIILPADLDFGLPEIHLNWGGFWGNEKRRGKKSGDFRRNGRIRIFRSFIKDIQYSKTPFLHFSHHLLPHMPYQFTPSGRSYRTGDAPRGYVQDKWTTDPWTITQGYQEFLMQVGACDTLLGELMEQLKKEGIFDKSLIIVTADHGVMFQSTRHRRGEPEDPTFYEDILSVPLFIKTPNQKLGVVNDSDAESIDILPTIFDVLGMKAPSISDGVSLLHDGGPQRARRKMILGIKQREKFRGNAKRGFDEFDFDSSEKPLRTTLDWKLETFGNEPAPTYSKFTPLFHRELLFRPISDFKVESMKGTASFADAGLNMNRAVHIDRKGEGAPLPIIISGTVKSSIPSEFFLALTVRGVVSSVTQVRKSESVDEYTFDFVVPEEAYRDGENQIEIFGVNRDNVFFSFEGENK